MPPRPISPRKGACRAVKAFSMSSTCTCRGRRSLHETEHVTRLCPSPEP